MTKIRDISAEIFERRVAASTAPPRFAADEVVHQALVSVRNEDGVVGECLVGGATRSALEELAAEATGFLAGELAGRSSAEREWLWNRLPTYLHYEAAGRPALAAVDVALWDLAGKEVGRPVCELLGKAHQALPAYISSAYHGSIEDYADEARACRDRGIGAYKPHPGGRRVEEAVTLAATVREAVGDGYRLILDASLAYSFDAALALGRALEELGYLWFEDPLPWAQEEAFAELGRRLSIPLAATDFAAAYFGDLVARARRDPGLRILRAGSRELGITGLKRATAFAETLGRRCELHIDDSTHKNLAALHVAISSPICEWFELVDPPEWVQWGTTTLIEADGDGLVRPPQGPGLGVELDREALDRARVARGAS